MQVNVRVVKNLFSDTGGLTIRDDIHVNTFFNFIMMDSLFYYLKNHANRLFRDRGGEGLYTLNISVSEGDKYTISSIQRSKDAIHPEHIWKEFKEYYGYQNIPKSHGIFTTRKTKYVIERGVTMCLFRALTELSLQAIGDYFNMDHSSVLHATRITIPSHLHGPSDYKEKATNDLNNLGDKFGIQDFSKDIRTQKYFETNY